MSVRHLTLIVVMVLLTGCSARPFAPEPPPEFAQLPCGPPQHEDDQVASDDSFNSLASIVIYRQQVCALPERERTGLLQVYRDDSTDSETIAKLMLASCVPDETPGQFAQSVAAAREQSDPPPGFFAFLELLAAQQRAYYLLESRLQTAEQQLEEMIEGIRAIETEMGADVTNEPSDTTDD